jgi:uncharacterized protein YeaO (DUF488 family)
MIKLKRVYEPHAPSDELRFLVERLRPRGVRAETLGLHAWFIDVVASDPPRRCFSHDPAPWQESRRQCAAQLDANPTAWQPIPQPAEPKVVTLFYSARNTEHNDAAPLKEYIEAVWLKGVPSNDLCDYATLH